MHQPCPQEFAAACTSCLVVSQLRHSCPVPLHGSTPTPCAQLSQPWMPSFQRTPFQPHLRLAIRRAPGHPAAVPGSAHIPPQAGPLPCSEPHPPRGSARIKDRLLPTLLTMVNSSQKQLSYVTLPPSHPSPVPARPAQGQPEPAFYIRRLSLKDKELRALQSGPPKQPRVIFKRMSFHAEEPVAGCRVENGVQLEVAGSRCSWRRVCAVGVTQTLTSSQQRRGPGWDPCPANCVFKLVEALVSSEVLVLGYHLF